MQLLIQEKQLQGFQLKSMSLKKVIMMTEDNSLKRNAINSRINDNEKATVEEKARSDKVL